jgi:phosphatidylglycerol lysyltransferase
VLLGVVLLGGAAWVLRREISALRVQDLRATLASLPPSHILWAALFTLGNYLVLTGYEQLGFAWLGRKLPRSKIMAASFSGYALSHGLGFPLLTGTSVRYRLYSRWGVPTAEFARLVIFYSGSFWLGLAAWTGISLVFFPLPVLGNGMARAAEHAVGGAMIASVIAYTVLGVFAREPIRLRGFSLSAPPLRITLPQLALVLADWALAAGALYALIPESSNPGYPAVLAAFVAAQTLGVISHVPGGVGVFEGAMLFLLSHAPGGPGLLSALLLFRCVYFLFPMTLVPFVLAAAKGYGKARRRRIATP